MANISPFEDGRSLLDGETLDITGHFTIGQDMVNLGYKMVSAEVDDAGYFLIVQFENIKLNHIRHYSTNIPLCKDNNDDFVILDLDKEKQQCPKCHRLIDERPTKEN